MRLIPHAHGAMSSTYVDAERRLLRLNPEIHSNEEPRPVRVVSSSGAELQTPRTIITRDMVSGRMTPEQRARTTFRERHPPGAIPESRTNGPSNQYSPEMAALHKEYRALQMRVEQARSESENVRKQMYDRAVVKPDSQ